MEDNKRLKYILEHFNIYVNEPTEDYEIISSYKSQPILIRHKETGKEYIGKYVFNTLVRIDPTNKKTYTQWLIQRIFDYIKRSEHQKLMRLLFEDAPIVKESLLIFEHKKKTKLFKDTVVHIPSLKKIKDVCNINQYNNIDLLLDAVDPFIERDYSELVQIVKNAINVKLGDLKYEDHKFLVYSPKTLSGSIILHPYATWCTARPSNSMFDRYTSNKTPFGTKSELLVFIDKETLKLFQIHFESGQVNKHNNSSAIPEFKECFLNISDGLAGFVENYLIRLIKGCVNLNNIKKDFNNIKMLAERYSKYLYQFGLINSYVNFIHKNETDLTLSGVNCLSDIDLSDLEKLQYVRLFSLNLKTFPILKKNNKIEILSLYGNSISYFPEDLKPFKNIKTLNLKNNHIRTIPDNISELDKSRGGSLLMLNIANNYLTESSIIDLKNKLPNVLIITE